MGKFINRKKKFTIPGEYNQFYINVTKELHDEYYAKVKTGEIKPYIYVPEKKQY